jgi:hypothetical protein
VQHAARKLAPTTPPRRAPAFHAPASGLLPAARFLSLQAATLRRIPQKPILRTTSSSSSSKQASSNQPAIRSALPTTARTPGECSAMRRHAADCSPGKRSEQTAEGSSSVPRVSWLRSARHRQCMYTVHTHTSTAKQVF